MIAVAEGLDLDGPYLDAANRRGTRARPVFQIETTWNPPNTKLATEPDGKFTSNLPLRVLPGSDRLLAS
jgi:hypothetical protein